MNLIRTTVTFALVGLLGACGGGADTPTVLAALFSTSNQEVAAREALTTAFMPANLVPTLMAGSAAGEGVLFSMARDQLNLLPLYWTNAKASGTAVAGVSSLNVPCTLGGSLTVTVTDTANEGVVSAGDRVTILSNACVDTAGTLSGSMDFAVNSLNGTLGSANYSAGIRVTFNNFSVSRSQFVARANGELTLLLSAIGINAVDATISSLFLSLSGSTAGEAWTRNLSNYSATFSRSPNLTYVYDSTSAMSGTLASSAMASHPFSFATPTTFIRHYTDAFPSSGVMLLIGGHNSMLKLSAVFSALVEMQLDANDDGIFEGDTVVRWAALM